MTDDTLIKKAVELLCDTGSYSKIILFGSRARGDSRKDSDLDLLVIEDQVTNKVREMIRLQRLLRPLGVGVDVLVFSRDEVLEWAHLPGTVLYWALKEGKTIYEKAS